MIKNRVTLENDLNNCYDSLINTNDNELNHVSETVNKNICEIN